MRKLKTRDIPAFCRVLKTLGIKEEVREIAKNADATKNVWDIGFDLIWRLLDVATEANGEDALYSFLAGPFEMTPDDVGDMDLPDLIAGLKQIAEENDLADFFRNAAQLMK